MAVNEKQKSAFLVIGFVGAVLMVVVVYFHFMIGRGKINDLERKSDKIAKEIRAGKIELTEIKGLMDQEDELEKQRVMIESVLSRLPDSPDAPGFLGEVISVLRKTNIVHTGVKPDKTKSFSQYTEIPYSIDAFGRYHELGQFLTLIEQNPQRFMRIKSFILENNPERPSIHPIQMDVATFMFTD